MIAGTGIDIVSTDRIDPSRAERLARRVLTDSEFEYCRGKSNFILHLSGRIAAKEAVFKALSPAGKSLSWKDIEISSGGVPSLAPGCRACVLMEKEGLGCSISISHDTGYAVAQAVAWRVP